MPGKAATILLDFLPAKRYIQADIPNQYHIPGYYMLTTLLWIVAVLLILTGFAGLVIPVIPGIPMMFCGFLLGAWIDGFERIGGFTVTALGLLALLSIGIDLLSPGFGSGRAGAGKRAILGAAIGSVVGIFFGLPGIIIGPFIGAVLGQLTASSDLSDAGRAGFGAWIGLLIGMAMKAALAFIMIGIFVLSFFL